MLASDAGKKFWEKCQRIQSMIYILGRKFILLSPTLNHCGTYFFLQLVLPFDCILQKPLHFWKRRDNSNV